MKKNNIMRIACALLVLTLLSTCVMSGTFAKYVTDSETATDTARVAKWGVNFTTQNNTLFDTTYATDDTEYTATITNSVVSSNTDNLVAPGTEEVGFVDFVVNGTPEVAFEVNYTAELTLTGWVDEDDNDYCPIIFTVENEEYYVGKDATITDAATLADAVEAAIAGCSKAYAPTTTAITTDDAPTVSWKWEFEKGTLAFQNDTDDTFLGDEAADGNAATINLVVSAQAVQID